MILSSSTPVVAAREPGEQIRSTLVQNLPVPGVSKPRLSSSNTSAINIIRNHSLRNSFKYHDLK